MHLFKGCQVALEQYHAKTLQAVPEMKDLTLTQFLDQLGIDKQLVGYDDRTMEFVVQ